MKELDLGKEKINKLILAFSIPCVISMLINSVYNIVDQIFIGKGVGTLGNGATNVIFPLVIVFNAFASLMLYILKNIFFMYTKGSIYYFIR